MKNKIRMIISDMDGTIVHYEKGQFKSTWDALYQGYGLQKENMDLWDYYHDKKELENEWTDKLVGLLKGLPIKKGIENLFPIPYSKGVKPFFKDLSTKYIRGILTTGISFVAEAAREELNMNFALSFILNHKNELFDGTYDSRVKLWGKADKLKEISDGLNISLDSICFIGDNENDISCFERVGLPIAFNPKTDRTTKSARYCIDDFKEINKILRA
ncbi:MAG: HAD hydrolase family protein [archaeon]